MVDVRSTQVDDRRVDLNNMLARNVRRFRQERQISMGELARLSGLSKQTLSKIEQGNGNPTLESIEAIANALHITARRLITEWGTPLFVQRAADAQWEGEEGWQTRAMDQLYGFGYVQTLLVRLTKAGPGSFGAGKSGTLHHVYVVAGKVRASSGKDTVDLAPGDFVRFPGDTDHHLTAVGAEATLHVVTTVPQVPQIAPAAP